MSLSFSEGHEARPCASWNGISGVPLEHVGAPWCWYSEIDDFGVPSVDILCTILMSELAYSDVWRVTASIELDVRVWHVRCSRATM